MEALIGLVPNALVILFCSDRDIIITKFVSLYIDIEKFCYDDYYLLTQALNLCGSGSNRGSNTSSWNLF